MAEPQYGRVCRAHVLALFKCERCGGDCERMTSAAVTFGQNGGQLAHIAPAPPGEVVCNECTKKERRADEKKIKIARQQRAWRKKKTQPPTTTGGGRREG